MAPRLVVVLVEPRYPGNVGQVARAMRNFGVRDLWLVKPCDLAGAAARDEARRMATHATDILEGARTFGSLEACVAELDLAVGTASDVARNEKRDWIRVPLRLRELAARLPEVGGTVGLVFGPEDTGLTNEDLARCDLLATIPSSPEHASLNLSHAAAITLYELRESAFPVTRPRAASRAEAERLLGYVARILDAMEIPEPRRRTTLQTFRRLLGRAVLSKWEYHRVMGVFSAALAAMEELRGQGKRVRAVRRAWQEAQRARPGLRNR